MPGKATSKSAGKQKVQAGPKGGMAGFKGVTTQKPGITSTTQAAGKGDSFAKGGPAGKMAGFTAVKPVKKA